MNPPTILLVDDDRELVQSLAARCRELGVEVLVALEVASAFELVHQRQPDLICLDISVPGGNGRGLCEAFSSDRQLAATPVIFLTAEDDVDPAAPRDATCAFFVPKGKDLWQRMEPIVRETLDVEPYGPEPAGRPAGVPVSASSRRDLSELCHVITRELAFGEGHVPQSFAQTPS